MISAHTETSPTAQRLAAEYKARQAKMPIEAKIIQLHQHDDHMKVHRLAKEELSRTSRNRIKRYIVLRAHSLGLSYEALRNRGRKAKIVSVRDLIVYELKTFIKPGISYPELGALFGKEHTTMISSYRRGAGIAGDHEVAALYWRKKDAMGDRYRWMKARAT